jgi:hypothetical protein
MMTPAPRRVGAEGEGKNELFKTDAKAVDRRRTKETGRPHEGRKDRRRNCDRCSADTQSIYSQLQRLDIKRKNAIRRLIVIGPKAKSK